MANCFTGTIGIKKAVGAITEPSSGIYIHNLPHIKFEDVDAAIGDDYSSAYDAISEIIDLAWLMTVENVRTVLSSKFRMNGVIEQTKVGFVNDNKILQSANSNYVGVNIRVNEYPYIEFFLSRVGLHVNTSGTVPLKVFDLIGGDELYSIDVTAVAGKPVYLDVSKKIKTNARKLNIFIGYDASSISSYKTNLNKSGFCSDCSGSPYLSNNYSQIRSCKIGVEEQKINENLVSINGTNGVLLDYSLACDIERFCCSIKNQLTFSVLYQSGMLILENIVASKRYSNIVRLYKTTFEEAITDYQQKHSQAMTNVLSSLKLPKDVCFECIKQVRTPVMIP